MIGFAQAYNVIIYCMSLRLYYRLSHLPMKTLSPVCCDAVAQILVYLHYRSGVWRLLPVEAVRAGHFAQITAEHAERGSSSQIHSL